MIYITGDSHGRREKFENDFMEGESTWTADDKLILCGDFGYVWYDDTFPEGKARYDEILDSLEQKPYDILFIDGNHENFDELYKYPEEERYGNLVHRIRRNIFHLQRGRIYTIENKTFFAFGGAYSIDKERRTKDTPDRPPDKPVSWWPQELPTQEEYDRGVESLKAVNYTVDYVVTHTAPDSALELLRYTMPYPMRNAYYPDPHDMELTSYFDMIWHNATFKRWYFGHWHFDEHLTAKARALLNDVEAIE